MSQWYEWNEIDDGLLKFAVLIAKYNGQYIIVYNNKRGGWELPGGNREQGETILNTASRELFEETGAVRFELIPFGIYEWNESFGMVFYAEVKEIGSLPNYEIAEIQFTDTLPEGLNFGGMFYFFENKWNEAKEKNMMRYSITISDLEMVNELMIN